VTPAIVEVLILSGAAVISSATWASAWLAARLAPRPEIDPRAQLFNSRVEMLEEERKKHMENLDSYESSMRRESQQRVKEIDREISDLVTKGPYGPRL
jgi:hypothetical protein